MIYFAIRKNGDKSFIRRTQAPNPIIFSNWAPAKGMQDEDPAWLQIEEVEVEGPSGPTLVKTTTINEQLKQQILSDRSAAEIDRIEKEKLEQNIQKGIAAMDFGKKVKSYVGLINVQKGWTGEQIVAFMSSPLVQKVNLLLDAGAIATAYSVIENEDFSAYYTEDDINKLKAMIAEFLN